MSALGALVALVGAFIGFRNTGSRPSTSRWPGGRGPTGKSPPGDVTTP